MEDHAREQLTNLLHQFLDPAQARAAENDIQAGEQYLHACPAPTPDPQTIIHIKSRIAATLARRRTVARTFRRSLAAAAVIAFAMLVLMDSGPTRHISTLQAATILPAAMWESNNIAAEDVDLVYFTGEIRLLEAQLRDLDADDGDSDASGAVDELEMELMHIETEFWKG